MIKRLFDLLTACIALLLLSPVLAVAVLGIRLSGKGPILFRAQRAGKNGATYTMYKFRTMRIEQQQGASRITAARDPRVFAWGSFLRKTKIDELPQLFNVVSGKMSIVGPRPEDLSIVEQHFTPWMRETLAVLPGMASPGSLFSSIRDYSSVYRNADIEDPEREYVEHFLPMKLAIEREYVRNQTFYYDIRVIFRTIWMLIRVVFGKREFPPPPEYKAAKAFLDQIPAH